MILPRVMLAVLSAHVIFADAINVFHRDSDSRFESRSKARSRITDGKYFQEPGGSELGNHYDSRFFGGIQTYEEKQDTQVHMMRAYLTFFAEKGVETWLAHGTLLGWWWNGKMLPWDWDIDTQISASSLGYLAEHLNFTTFKYTSRGSDPPISREYLLDVNPYSVERERGNGLNIIDARWIDIRNGLYIDITGLSETHPDVKPGVWSCKNYHRYQTTDLYPMRETMYQGVVAKVPYAYDRILTEEYHDSAMVLTEYEGHRWNPDLKEWIKKSDSENQAENRNEEEKKQEEEGEKALDKEKEKNHNGDEEDEEESRDENNIKTKKR